MKTIESIGKTVNEAIENGIKKLNTSKDKVDIKILDQGSKGFLNLIGSRPAKIELTLKKNDGEDARKFLDDILTTMGIKAKINITDTDKVLKIDLSGDNMGIIIGYRGETLDALQYLVSLVINKNNFDSYKRVILDTENYRAKREETLKRLAKRLASRVKKTNKLIKLEPMNPYERRIIHSQLQEDSYIETYSEGDEPFRKVVIDLRKA